MNLSTHLGYRRPELLAEPDWLWERRDVPNIRLIDCASPDAYGRAHIPGAVGLPVHVWLKEPEGGVHVMGPESFAQLMGKLGVSDDTTVVCYDDWVSAYATRLWWVLNYYGHTNAKVLNGGWRRWVLEGRPITFHETEPQPTRFTATENEAVMCRIDYLLRRYKDDDVQVVFVLPEGMFLGTDNPFENARVGHIPGSVNVPYDRFLSEDDRGVFKSAPELTQVLTEARLTPEKETIVHCQAGVATTLGFFVLKLLGWDRVRAYDAAMAEWANRDDTPLVLGNT